MLSVGSAPVLKNEESLLSNRPEAVDDDATG